MKTCKRNIGEKSSDSYFHRFLIASVLIVMLAVSAVPGTAAAGSTFYAVTPMDGTQHLVGFDLDSVENEIIEVTSSVMLNYNGKKAPFYTNAISFSPTGELFGWGALSTPGYEGMGQLYTVDVTSGAVTMIGEMQDAPSMYGMAFDSDGTLYGLSRQHLYSINVSTGERTMIGTEIIDGWHGGLTIDHTTGELYAWTGLSNVQDRLLRIDKTTGQVTIVPIGFDVEDDGVGVEINPDNGEMVALRGGNMIYSTDINTGESTYLGVIELNGVPITAHSLTVAAVVPEPVSSALFIIGGATLGFRRFRKRITN